MRNRIFIRNVQASDQLELFIVSAISSLLLLRYYLYLTGYPQVGNGTLHIAHMLYGGLFMMIAVVLLLSFLGHRLQRFCALIGGVGFGIFIDEIGKFITRDNNYFFRPSIGIIYAIFVLLYLGTSLITRRSSLSSTEYQLNALAQLEEAVLHDMDTREKTEVRTLINKADSTSQVTRSLLRMLDTVKAEAPKRSGIMERLYQYIDTWYERAWESRRSNMVVRLFFTFEILLFLIAVVGAIISNVSDVRELFIGKADYGHSLIIGQALGTLVAAYFGLRGVLALRVSRVNAFEWFRRATLANLLLTEFFIFSRIQFGAMAGFLFNLVLLLLINFIIAHEKRN